MAGVWKRDGTVAVTNGSKKVTGTGTTFADAKNGVAKGHLFCMTTGTTVDLYEVDYVVSNTELHLVQAFRGATGTGKAYEIITTFSDSIPEFARKLNASLSYYQSQSDMVQQLFTSDAAEITVTAPDGTTHKLIPWKRVTSEGEGQAARAKVEADRSKAEADRAAAAANATAEAGTGSLMRVGGLAILDSERYSLERATGGSQTIIRDSAGNANVMFVLPRFSYADLGMTADMGTGDVTAFDFGSGSIKSEIFIGAYLASGSGAVSAPRQDPRASLDHTAARNACSAKGAGWHLMTAHEWAAISLWCMANGYEPIGNTNWGRSHAKTCIVGDRADNRAPGDGAGTGRTQTGSMGAEATHNRTPIGIADLVGNIWEWQDGFLLQDGRFKLSAFNAQAEADWAFTDAYLDASSPTGGSPILSNAITNRLGAIGDNANAGNSANSDWRIMAKAGGYVSNQALRRLLIEPATILPQGRIYMRNFGERLPCRGGDWNNGADAGLAAVLLYYSRAFTDTSVGFRPAFA
ncbi:hypothetical protein GRF56_16575 [Aeromonas veronii]|uniref:hypothetical protein n=1 Tax=Aeromonas veronii TaxID=654 RepID=UPI00131620B2|nr:hypothetical protein [Aeromonas veronii]QHC08900.1 hypothetical protein GRF56_16575 [Aeromonas veronii]